MFILLPRNCNHTVTQVTLQGIGVNSLHLNTKQYLLFLHLYQISVLSVFLALHHFHMQRPLPLCLCSHFIFCLPISPYHVAIACLLEDLFETF